MAETPLDVLCIHCGLILVDFKRGGTPEHAYEIQCDPRDYIRAWLGPVGNLFKKASEVKIGFENRLNIIEHAGVCLTIQYAVDCPPALAAAMGKDIWKRTENGWAPVE
jgi:hypothetical protein